jgi:protein-tyrosine phosphatase
MAEALMRRTLADRGVDVTVSSAGLLYDGEPATVTGVDTMEAWGLDISGHHSRRMTSDLIGSAGLIVGMARQHVREAVVLRPDLYPHVFTLKELVRRGSDIGPRSVDESLESWLARVHEGRRPTDQLGESPDDDVADPVGQGPAVYERTARELDDLITRLVDLLWHHVRSAAPA